MHQVDLRKLLKKYKAGTCTEEELALLENWYLQWEVEHQDVDPDRLEKIKKEVWDALPAPAGQKTFRLWPRIAAAIVLVAVISAGIYLYRNPVRSGAEKAVQIPKNDIPPAGNRATLTLADGSTIVLDGTREGELTDQAGLRVIKLDSGLLAYRGNQQAQSIQYNTLTTPRGGQYQVILPDGTRVWLNAASSITYPTGFTGAERRVKITGEAYFEVTEDARMPFRVMLPDQSEVEVLGTHFNIMAYEDEASIRTTLLEGSVKVIKNKESNILKPGQQARIGEQVQVLNVNIEEAVSWKNGYFIFNQETIQSIMRKVSRWYNVEIRYEGEMPDDGFSGTVSRFENVSGVLELLELTGRVHFKIEEGRVTVMP